MQLEASRSPRGRRSALAGLAVAPLAAIFLLLGAAAPAGAAPTLSRVRQAGVIKLGYVPDARPFSYEDEAGKPAGYSVALCEKIAAAVGAKLGMPKLRTEFVPVSLEARFDAVKQGRVDLLCGADSVTLSRREKVSFSIPVFPGGVGALMRKDAPSRMRKILAGEPEPYRPRWRASLGQILEKRVFAVRPGTTTEAWLKSKIDEFDIIATIDPVEDYDQGVDRVLARRDDVLFGDRAILLDAARTSPAAGELLVLDRRFTYEALALALQRTDEDFRLLVDRTLSELYRSDEIKAVYSPYFGEPDSEAQRFFRTSALPE